MITINQEILSDSLKTLIKEWCRKNCLGITKLVSITGSIHLSGQNGQTIFNCLLQEELTEFDLNYKRQKEDELEKPPVKPARTRPKRRKSFTSSATSLVEKCFQGQKSNKKSIEKTCVTPSPPIELPSDVINYNNIQAVKETTTITPRQRSHSLTNRLNNGGSCKLSNDNELSSSQSFKDTKPPMNIKELLYRSASIGGGSCMSIATNSTAVVGGNGGSNSMMVSSTTTTSSCSFCNMKFTQESCLKDHVIKVHMQIKMHECLLCKRDFYSKGALRMHQIRQHKEYNEENNDDKNVIETAV